MSAENAVVQYSQAYQKLYNRIPSDLRALDQEWVVVNGARMRANELQYLAAQLEHEYNQGVARRKSIVNRLLAWFKQ